MKRATQQCMFVCMCEESTAKICGKTTVCEMYSYETFCFATDTRKNLRQIKIYPLAGFNEDFYNKKTKMWKKALQCRFKGSTSQANTCTTQFKMCIKPVVTALK